MSFRTHGCFQYVLHLTRWLLGCTLLEQNEFNITFKSFYDNKVLKNCQLDMLIFVQVYMTIDINFEIINRFWKNKR